MKKSRTPLCIVIGTILVMGCGGEKKADTTASNEPNIEKMEKEIYVHDSMNIVVVANTPISETPHKVDVRKVYDNPYAQVMIIMLKPGEKLKPHITPVDVFFYVLEGTVDVMIGDETKSVAVDCLVESPKNIKHCLYNNSDLPARIMVVKVPRPETASKLL